MAKIATQHDISNYRKAENLEYLTWQLRNFCKETVMNEVCTSLINTGKSKDAGDILEIFDAMCSKVREAIKASKE